MNGRCEGLGLWRGRGGRVMLAGRNRRSEQSDGEVEGREELVEIERGDDKADMFYLQEAPRHCLSFSACRHLTSVGMLE